MNRHSCHVRNLQTGALSGFRQEKDALSAGGHYLNPGDDGWLDAAGRTGLCVVCENCGSVVEEVYDEGELTCPDCGETTFRVFQTFRLVTIKGDFSARWHVPGFMVAIDVPASAQKGMIGLHYTVDGSEPTLGSPLYTKPFAYHKEDAPLRAAVYYPDARSQIIEWDYGRAEKNRNQIRRQSRSRRTTEPPQTKPRRPRPDPIPIPPAKPPRPETPEPSSTEKKGKDENKGCIILIFIAKILGGFALIHNDWSMTGWVLVTLGVLGIIGLFQDEK